MCDDCVTVDGKRIPLSRFDEVVEINGKRCKYNRADNCFFVISASTENDSESDFRSDVPEDYKKKFCVFLEGIMFHCFNTINELEQFKNSETARSIPGYTYYYPGM